MTAILHIELDRIKDVYESNPIVFVIDKIYDFPHIEHERIMHVFIFNYNY